MFSQWQTDAQWAPEEIGCFALRSVGRMMQKCCKPHSVPGTATEPVMDDCLDSGQSFAVMPTVWWTCQKDLFLSKLMICWIHLHRLIFSTPGSELWFVVVQSCLGQWIIGVARCLRRDFSIKVLAWVLLICIAYDQIICLCFLTQ